LLKNFKSRPLWVHILVGLALAFIVILIVLKSLDWITRHGTTRTIPSVLGKTYDEAVTFLEDQGFEVMIQDSIYNDTAKPTMVLRQFPEADATVKRNRTVYLTINRAIPPLIEMPSLEGMTFRSAELALKQYGLNLKDTVYRNHMARNAILEVQYNGAPIRPGTRIHMGSEIVLVLGTGIGDEEFRVPDLFGRTFGEAKTYLEAMGLILGSVVPVELAGNPNAYVARQMPEVMTPDGRPNTIRAGQIVDLFLQVEKPARVDSTGNTPASDYQ
jgi:beta-lactam-binding protein with PASTA domain